MKESLRLALAAFVLVACWRTRPDQRRVAPMAAHPGVAASADELFALRFVPTLELTLGPDARLALEQHPRQYTEASLGQGGRTYPMRIKLKGNRTFRRLDDKPAFRIKFTGGGFLGLHGLVLNNLVDDPTGLREILAYRLYRAAGVPAPRAAFARVTIDGVAYGTYLMVEPIDSHLIREQVGGAPAATFEGEYGCDLFPADTPRIQLKHGEEADARAAFARLAALADGDVHALFDDARSLAAVPEVLSFLAVGTLVGDFDGYWHSHNYFLSFGPPDHRWRILPWGEDRVFHDHVPIYDSQGRLARLCFADHDCRLAYSRRLLELADLLPRLARPAELQQLLGLASALLDDDVRSKLSPDQREHARRELVAFVRDRPDEIHHALTCLDAGSEIDRDGDGSGCMDCNDGDASVHPGAPETCDKIDNDCNGLVDDAPACPCTPVEVAGARFQLCDLPMSWQAARDACHAKGMSLARFDTAEQATQVYARAVALRKDRWWLGARQADDAHFAWDDGAPFSFTYWGEGEPRNHHCQQRCLVLDDGGAGTWALGHCELYFPFVCRSP